MKFTGHVVKGMGLGKQLGFPTFNLDARPELEHGVYAVEAVIPHAPPMSHHALMHYGPKPSVGRDDVFCEVYFLNFPEGLEVTDIEVSVLGKLRDVMHFASLDSLVEQMKMDEADAIEHYFKA